MVNTKQQLASSLKKMMLKKPYSKITVSDVTDNCNLNRMTFYYHFQDLIDLVEWTLKEDIKKATKNKFTYETWREGYRNIFELMSENRVYFLTMYHAFEKERIRRCLYECFHDYIYKIVSMMAYDSDLKESDLEFITNFYKYAFVETMMNWFEHDMKEKPEQVISKVNLIMNGNMHQIIHRFHDTYQS